MKKYKKKNQILQVYLIKSYKLLSQIIDILYFVIREQKQILIIENRFIVFLNIPH